MNIILAVIVVILVLVFMYYTDLFGYGTFVKSFYNKEKEVQELPDDDNTTEKMVTDDPKANSINTYQPKESDTLKALGYGVGQLPWDEVIQFTELDPGTMTAHKEFVKDVRRFSSGANFTSVTDDNTNLAFVNFQGLRRPEHVKIGSGSRQIPDVDETVLQRNKVFRWNSTS